MTLATNALTTLATLKTDLGISDSSSDSVLEALINAASDSIENYCGRSFYKRTVTAEGVRGYGTRFLKVAVYPIDTSEDITIEYDDVEIQSDSYEVDDANAGTIISKYGFFAWTAGMLPGGEWHQWPGSERKIFEIDYVGGYVTPKQVDDETYDTRTLPYDLEMACRIQASTMYRKIGVDRSIQREQVLDASVSYFENKDTAQYCGLEPIVAMMVAGYREVVV